MTFQGLGFPEKPPRAGPQLQVEHPNMEGATYKQAGDPSQRDLLPAAPGVVQADAGRDPISRCPGSGWAGLPKSLLCAVAVLGAHSGDPGRPRLTPGHTAAQRRRGSFSTPRAPIGRCRQKGEGPSRASEAPRKVQRGRRLARLVSEGGTAGPRGLAGGDAACRVLGAATTHSQLPGVASASSWAS